jgi:hypothetical protein
MSKQTAVEFLAKSLKDFPHIKHSQSFKDLVKQAKALEKEQMIIFYWGGYDNGYIDNGKLGEEYYNEKYGGDNV